MSAVATHASPSPDDLQELYQQVLAGFAEESPSTDSPLTLASSANDQSPYQPSGTQQTMSHRAGYRECRYYCHCRARCPLDRLVEPPNVQDAARPLPSPSARSVSSKPPRPLPRLPGSTSSSPSPTYAMPEAQPYQPDALSPTAAKRAGNLSVPFFLSLPPHSHVLSTTSDISATVVGSLFHLTLVPATLLPLLSDPIPWLAPLRPPSSPPIVPQTRTLPSFPPTNSPPPTPSSGPLHLPEHSQTVLRPVVNPPLGLPALSHLASQAIAVFMTITAVPLPLPHPPMVMLPGIMAEPTLPQLITLRR